VICRTFGNVFANDHTRNDVYHAPILVCSEEVFQRRDDLFAFVNHCWAQESWSSSINPKGAYFCEIAASLALLLDGSKGWKVEERWWMRTPKDFTSQIEEFCPKCGCCLPLRRRASIDNIDDISEGMLKRLKGKSMKIDKGLYKVSNLELVDDPEPMAAYKDLEYRERIANRYGMFFTINEKRFWEPHLRDKFDQREIEAKKPLMEQYRERFCSDR
jgi:hypothetical protein